LRSINGAQAKQNPDEVSGEDRFVIIGLSANLRLLAVCHCARGVGNIGASSGNGPVVGHFGFTACAMKSAAPAARPPCSRLPGGSGFTAFLAPNAASSGFAGHKEIPP
jgi:hypothetical protein